MEENLVRKTCKELGITQKKLSEITEFATQTISKWNNNSKMPNNALLQTNFLKEQMLFYLKIHILKNENQFSL